MDKINLEVLKILEVNKEYTYKELCDLGLFNKYFTGLCNGKKNQFKALDVYCKLVKKSRGKYFIKEMYSKMQISDKLSSSSNQNHIQLLVLDELVKADKNNIVITARDLMFRCGMINNNYCCKDIDIAYTLNKDIDIVDNVLSLTDNKNRGYIKRGLDGLKKKKLILLEYMLFVNEIIYLEYTEDLSKKKW